MESGETLDKEECEDKSNNANKNSKALKERAQIDKGKSRRSSSFRNGLFLLGFCLVATANVWDTLEEKNAEQAVPPTPTVLVGNLLTGGGNVVEIVNAR